MLVSCNIMKIHIDAEEVPQISAYQLARSTLSKVTGVQILNCSPGQILPDNPHCPTIDGVLQWQQPNNHRYMSRSLATVCRKTPNFEFKVLYKENDSTAYRIKWTFGEYQGHDAEAQRKHIEHAISLRQQHERGLLKLTEWILAYQSLPGNESTTEPIPLQGGINLCKRGADPRRHTGQ
jgi:hypothetical protein